VLSPQTPVTDALEGPWKGLNVDYEGGSVGRRGER
jgi:hypothetical protein